VLPGFNEGENIKEAFDRLKIGEQKFSQYFFFHFPVDDLSKDNTYEEIWRIGEESGLKMLPHQNSQNQGLVATLKDCYQKVLSFSPFDYVLATAWDKDIDQVTALHSLIPFAETDADFVTGIRWRDINPRENQYEHARRSHIMPILENEIGIKGLDPVSCAAQFYKTKALEKVLFTEDIADYDKRWGLDFRIPVKAAAEGFKVQIKNLGPGKYDPARRLREKVKSQFDAYLQTIADFTGQTVQELEQKYGPVPE
jgi:hypothetical protein